MKRLSRLVFIALVALTLISLLVACNQAIGSRTTSGSNQLPAAVQPAQGRQVGSSSQSDLKADALEQALTDLDHQLESVDVLNDLK